MVLGRIVGTNPRPRALIGGFDDETTERLAALFPSSLILTDRTVGWEWPEWDVVVIRGYLEGIPDSLDLLAFSPPDWGSAEGIDRGLNVRYVSTTYAREFHIPEDLHPDLLSLVERVLLPMARTQGGNRALGTSHPMSMSSGQAVTQRESWLTPFLSTTEPRVLAGSFVRRGGRSEAWCLPEGVEDPVPWVRAALRVWHERTPERYPLDPGWPSDPEWMTADELMLTQAIKEMERERAELVAESERRELALRSDLRKAQDAAERGRRRLLTAKGDALVSSVMAALEELGFTVENRDESIPEGEPRLEDLRVTSPDDPEWVAIAEVRGYSGGAAQNDLLRIGRFVLNFREETGRAPDRSWYLVNQFIGRDPGARPPVLEPHRAEISEFEAQNGLAMDTADLFRLVRAVDDGALTKTQARHHLMTSKGRATSRPDG